MRTGDAELANRIYSGVPADMLGRQQVITVGPMSGEANVIAWLESRDISCTPEMIKDVLAVAKATDHVLTGDEIRSVLDL
jgi:2-isopropylmalate synthase